MLTWAEAIKQPPITSQLLSYKNPRIYLTVARDMGFAYPFKQIPNILLKIRYPGSTLPTNEIVYRHIYPAGQAANMELLQICHTTAHNAIRKRLGMSLLHTNSHGDTITMAKKKKIGSKREWTLKGDIRARFSNNRSASAVYDQQISQHNDRGTKSGAYADL